MLEDLTDQESQSLTDFFVTTQGSLQPFLFLDPTANLLLWSEDLTNSAWAKPGITFDSAIADPFGGTGALRAHNQTAASATISQQSQIPGEIQTCFSAYLRTDSPATVALSFSVDTQSQSLAAAVTSIWQRFYVSGTLSSVTDTLSYAIDIPVGAAVEIFGPQVDAQVTPSLYVGTTGWSGVCASARFDGTQIDRIATGPNRNTCVMFIRCNLPDGE